MESNKIAMAADDVARALAAACVTATASGGTDGLSGAYGFAVRVTPPVVVQGPQENSALRTDGISVPHSGHLPWSPPV